MGFVEKNFTLVTSLTQKGKEYFLSKDKSKFNIKFFSLSDSDTNYKIASSTTSLFVHNNLKIGYVTNLSGYNDSSVDCLRYLANGVELRHFVGGTDDCSLLSEFINPYTNELSCNKVDFPVIYPYTDNLTTSALDTLNIFYPNGKNSNNDSIIIFNQLDELSSNFNINAFLGSKDNNINTVYKPFGLEGYYMTIYNNYSSILNINTQLKNVNNGLLNEYKFVKDGSNINNCLNFDLNINNYGILPNYGLNDLMLITLEKNNFIEGLVESLPTDDITINKNYIIKAYKPTTVSMTNSSNVNLGNITNYVINGLASVLLDTNYSLNSSSPDGLEVINLGVYSSDINVLQNIRLLENNKNILPINFKTNQQIYSLNNKTIQFDFDESKAVSGSSYEITIKLFNPNKFVLINNNFYTKKIKFTYI